MLIAATFVEQVSTVILGFALTTVLGGALGSWFQRRTWDDRSLVSGRSSPTSLMKAASSDAWMIIEPPSSSGTTR
jgi:hypothetical protein